MESELGEKLRNLRETIEKERGLPQTQARYFDVLLIVDFLKKDGLGALQIVDYLKKIGIDGKYLAFVMLLVFK